MDKGTTVYLYDEQSDQIEAYEFEEEFSPDERYWKEDYIPRYYLSKNGRRISYMLFRGDELFVSLEDAQAERDKRRSRIRDRYEQNGVIKTLFDSWRYGLTGDGHSMMSENVMRDIIKEKWNLDV